MRVESAAWGEQTEPVDVAVILEGDSEAVSERVSASVAEWSSGVVSGVVRCGSAAGFCVVHVP